MSVVLREEENLQQVAPIQVAEHTALHLKSALYEKGICSIKGAFSREWASQLGAEHKVLMDEALLDPSKRKNRGPNRFYHAVHPERLSGFVDLVTHPALVELCKNVLGPDYQFVELGFDVPMPGAKNQPWHRDFPAGIETLVGRWLSSLVFNVTTVDVTKDMGAFEISHGTHWEDGADFADGMFPRKSEYHKYESSSVLCYPQLGDVSCRTGLTIHRGTEHNASIARPVLCLGVAADLIARDNKHKLMMTKTFYNSLPEELKPRLRVELVDELVHINQEHDIEGLRY